MGQLMGRTIPSWRMMVEDTACRWGKFREALRKNDREAFDDLMNQCRLYASAAGAAALPTRSEAIFLSILFAHHKMLMEILYKIEEIKKQG
jgi:hypothetical protein